MTKRDQQAADYRFEIVRDAQEADAAWADDTPPPEFREEPWKTGRKLQGILAREMLRQMDRQFLDMADGSLPTLGDGSLPPEEPDRP